jgi:hypothetical protein
MREPSKMPAPATRQRSATWANGRQDKARCLAVEPSPCCSAMAVCAKAPKPCTAPFGMPVVPEV